MLLSTNTVKADTTGTTDTSKNSTATFQITNAANPGSLTLDKVPDYNFTESLDNLSNNISGTTKGSIQVTDGRGTGAGWTLTAQLGNFTNEAGKGWSMSTGNSALTQTPTDSKLNGAPTPQNATLVAGGDAGTVLNADPGTGIETWSDALTNPVLNTDTVTPTITTETAQLTWNLNDTPTSASTTDSTTTASATDK